MISDQKYSFSVPQKYFFAVRYKISIFHRIKPNYGISIIIISICFI